MRAALGRAIRVGEERAGMRGGHLYMTPALMCANEAIADKDFETALMALDSVQPPQGSWTCRIQTAYGDLYAAMGDKPKAEECYRRALSEKEVRDAFLEPVREKLVKLVTSQ